MKGKALEVPPRVLQILNLTHRLKFSFMLTAIGKAG